MQGNAFRPGDWVVYHKTKHSVCPGPRAVAVTPSQCGDTYSYVVEKFWVVAEVNDDRVVLRTRRGKQHIVPANDPNLERPGWFKRWLYRRRFQSVAEASSGRHPLPQAAE